ncbi:MAG: Unknown protein [uncultured Sulfurovum sp.]|uniref:Ankyrin repeat protein n=1 Tax=uncultured Sulfurovum sp. TaxID=269237 RepID=A0A6S6U7H4_9BACT|nr:MAG: Unknown protein [uncultured Sulfurovum sp.]
MITKSRVQKIILTLTLVLFFGDLLQAEVKEVEHKTSILYEKILKVKRSKGIAELKQHIHSATFEELDEGINLSVRGEKRRYSLINFLILKKPYLLKKILPLLVEKGVSLNSTVKHKVSPLELAIRRNRLEIVELLLKEGASYNIIVDRVPLFYMALQSYNNDLKNLLLSYKPKLIYTEEMKKRGRSYLTWALVGDNLSPVLVKYLLEQGEDINKVHLNGYEKDTPYSRFLKKYTINRHTKNRVKAQKQLEVLNLLLDTGVEPFFDGNSGCVTPLSVIHNDVVTLRKLLNKGLNPNTIGCNRGTYLAVPVMLGELEVFKVMMKEDGDLYALGIYGTQNILGQIVSTSKAGDILEWLVKNKKEVFENLSEEVAGKYVNSLVHAHKDGSFYNLVDTLLKFSSDYQKSINHLLVVAIRSNKLQTANHLKGLGAKILVADSQKYWESERYWDDHSAKNTRKKHFEVISTKIDWLLKENVSPFLGEKAVTKIINFSELTLEQFHAIFQLYPKKLAKKEILDEVFITLLENLDFRDKLVLNEEKLLLLLEYGLVLEDVKTSKNTLYMPFKMKYYMEHNRNIELLWLLKNGARVCKENQADYIKSVYMRALIDRAGSDVEKIDFYPQNERESHALDKVGAYSYKDKWYVKHKNLFQNNKFKGASNLISDDKAVEDAYNKNDWDKLYLLMHEGGHAFDKYLWLKAKDHSQYNGLTSIILQGKVEILKWLIDNKVPIDARFSERTPLIVAVKKESIEMIDLLIKAGANSEYVNQMHFKEESAISLSQKSKNPKIQVYFSDKISKDTFSVKALNDAIYDDDLPLVKKILSSGINPNMNSDGPLPLAIAIRVERLEILDYMLGHGVDVNDSSRSTTNALIDTSASQKDPELMHCVLKHGARVNFSNHKYNALKSLFGASGKHWQEKVKLLVDYNTSLTTVFNEAGQLVIHAVMQHAQEDLIYYIIDKMLKDGDSKALFRADNYGQTILHYAVAYQSEHMVQKLLDLGVDPKVISYGGQQAIFLASSKETLKLLESSSTDKLSIATSHCTVYVENEFDKSKENKCQVTAKFCEKNKRHAQAVWYYFLGNDLDRVKGYTLNQTWLNECRNEYGYYAYMDIAHAYLLSDDMENTKKYYKKAIDESEGKTEEWMLKRFKVLKGLYPNHVEKAKKIWNEVWKKRYRENFSFTQKVASY